MAVKEKIDEAKYFLDKIKNATERKDVIPNLSAYLCSTRSILDYLLEDYNVKYGLKVTLDERLDKKIFEKVAMTRKNSNAMEFIIGYNSRLKKVMNLSRRCGYCLFVSAAFIPNKKFS